MPGLENPFEITPSLLFAGLFVALTMITMVVRNAAGNVGILTLSALVGVVDIDPFILSMVREKEIALNLIVAAVILAMMSNTLAKGLYFSALVPGVRRATLWRYAVWAAAHLPLILTS
jgi:uncharacterized membrane protein (DUF4010 family)